MNQGNGQGGWQPPPAGAPVGQQPVQPQQPMQQPQQPVQQPQQPVQQPQQPMPPAGYAQPGQQQMPQNQPNYDANPFVGFTSGYQSNVRHPYLEDGDYKLKISAIKLINARSGKTYYTIEGDILESNNPLRPPGMRVVCFINLSLKDTAPRHCAAFISSLFGVEPQTLPKDSPLAPWVDQEQGQQMPWEYYLSMSVHDAQPFTGREVGVNVTTVEKKNSPGEFSLHTWHPASEFVVPPTPAPSPAQQNQQVPPPPPQQAGQQNWSPPPGQGAPQQPQQPQVGQQMGGQQMPQQPQQMGGQQMPQQPQPMGGPWGNQGQG